MKYIYKFSFLLLLLAISSCSKGDVFTGSPLDSNIEKVQLVGTISTTETNVVSGQPFNLTVTLPQTFNVNVNVEATSFLPNTNRRSLGTVIIPAGQTTATFQMKAAGADSPDMPYHNNLQVYLSAISTDPLDTASGFIGKQYSISSNVLNLDFGDASLSVIDHSMCSVRLDYVGPHYRAASIPYNGLLYKVIKDGTLLASLPVSAAANSSTSVYGKSNYQSGDNYMNILNVAKNGTPTDGVYIMKIYAPKLITDPTPNMQCRFTIRFPDEKAKTLYCEVPNMPISATVAGGVEKLKIVKSDLNGAPHYEASIIP
jgi:hypothetical protein